MALTEKMIARRDGVRAPTDAPVETQVRIVRRGTTEQISAPDAEQSSWERIYDDTSPAFLMLGYGATRRVEGSDSVDISARRKSRLLRYQRVAGLFEEHITMVPLNAWLPEWETRNPGRYKQVINLLDRLLPEGMRFRAEREQGQYLFEHRGVKISFGAMSDGYRQYVGWISDLLYHVCMGCPPGKKLEENRGIVLIDEIDLHLHPEWQRTVIPTMSTTLPNLQFILTSHSPIVVGTLHRENVIVFNQDSEGASIAEPVEIEVHGLNADQVLTSRAFGLTSSRAPEFVEQLKQTSAQAQQGDEEAQRRFHKMIVYGAGADMVQSKVEAAPPEVIEAARRLSSIQRAAVLQPRVRRPAKKKPAATKKSARKKKRSARKKR